jgi:hypothetical protein
LYTALEAQERPSSAPSLLKTIAISQYLMVPSLSTAADGLPLASGESFG